MSLTIFSSETKYTSSPNTQIVLNELAQLWDTTNWKNDQGVSVVYEEDGTNVKELYVSDYITIGKTDGTTQYLKISHSNGGSCKGALQGVGAQHVLIAKAETGLIIHSISTAHFIGIGKTTDINGNEGWGVISTSLTSAPAAQVYTFTADGSAVPTSTNMAVPTGAKITSAYYTQLVPVYTLGSTERFVDLMLVKICPPQTSGKTVLNGENYYISSPNVTNMLALKYT